jgi:Ca2+-transporting ATPase
VAAAHPSLTSHDSNSDLRAQTLTEVGALVNDAALEARRDGLLLHGDPTETALLVAALKAGCDLGDLARRWPRLREIPFDPATRLMATCTRHPRMTARGWS